MISLGRKAVGRPKRHSLTTSSTDFSYDNRYSPSSKEFVTLSKFPSSVPRRHSPSGLSPPVMMSEAATTTTTTGGVQKEWSKSAVPTWFILCQHLFRLPPMPSLGWSIDRPVPNKGFRRRVWRGTETQSKSSRFFLTPFLTKKPPRLPHRQKRKAKGKNYQKRRPADAWRRVSDTSAIGHFEEETLGKVHHLSYIQLLTRLSEWTSLIGNQQYIHTHARTDRLPSSVAHPHSWWRANQSGASSMMYVEPRFSPQQLWWVFDFQSLISESFDREWKQNPGKAPQSGCFESLINQQSGLAINLWPSACWLAAAADDDDEESCAPETRSRYTGRADKAKIYLPVNHQFSDDFILRYSQQSSQLQMS